MDMIDRKLVAALEVDGRESYASLARHLHVAESAVRRRVTRLLQDGIIRIVAVPDYSKLGLRCCAMIGLDVDLQLVDSAMEALAKDDRVHSVVATTGRFDICIGVDCVSVEELSHFVSEVVSPIEGIRQSETFVYLKLRKSHRRLDVREINAETAKPAQLMPRASRHRSQAA